MVVQQHPGAARASRVPVPRNARPSTRVTTVVVGVDGSESSIHALTWAMRHAAEHGLELVVLTAWPLAPRSFVTEVPGHFNEARWEAREAQQRAVSRALERVDVAPPVIRSLVNATVLDAVVEAAGPSTLLVLGTDFSSAEAGTSLIAVVGQEASGPVVVVPPPR